MKRKLLLIIIVIALLCTITIIVCNRKVKGYADSKTYTEVMAIPYNDVGRELLARVKMFIDLAIDKQPHFLGEKIVIGK